MRKLLIAGIVAVALSTTACAQPHHHRKGDWVAPLIIGGVIGAVIANQDRQPQPHIYVPPPPPVIYYPGTVYRDYTYRPMYKMVDVYIPECNCYRSVPVQIN